jgi:ABC-type Fe3+ transport system permease subunit
VALANLDSIGHGKETWFSDQTKLVQKRNDIKERLDGSQLIWTAVIFSSIHLTEEAQRMRISALKSVMVSVPSAILASLCCVLPLTVVLLGIGSEAVMMTTMKYSVIFIPVGVFGVGLGYLFYFREKRKCGIRGCHMVAGRLNLIALVLATTVVATAIVFNLFPGLIAPLLTGDY